MRRGRRPGGHRHRGGGRDRWAIPGDPLSKVTQNVTHHSPQRFQVAVAKNRSEIVCGSVEVEFVARKEIARVPTVPFNTPRGPIRVASVEATALDLIGYPTHT